LKVTLQFLVHIARLRDLNSDRSKSTSDVRVRNSREPDAGRFTRTPCLTLKLIAVESLAINLLIVRVVTARRHVSSCIDGGNRSFQNRSAVCRWRGVLRHESSSPKAGVNVRSRRTTRSAFFWMWKSDICDSPYTSDRLGVQARSGGAVCIVRNLI
jgi:hypothetical protein